MPAIERSQQPAVIIKDFNNQENQLATSEKQCPCNELES
jgi:hypothetical protein